MRKLIALLAFCLIGIQTLAQDAPKPKESTDKPKEVHMGVGRTVTYPVRHPIKTQKGVAKFFSKVGKAIW